MAAAKVLNLNLQESLKFICDVNDAATTIFYVVRTSNSHVSIKRGGGLQDVD